MTTRKSAGDGAEMTALMSRFLGSVSFVTGSRPDYPAILDLFSDRARLTNNSGSSPQTWTVDEFIQRRKRMADSGELTSFEEVETTQATELFGNIAHRLSTYQKRGVTAGAAFETRGVISTQFIRTPAGWKITSVAWDDERPGLTVPALAPAAAVDADERFFDALLRADTAALDAILAADFVIVDVISGGVSDRTALLAGLASGGLRFVDVVRDSQQGRVLMRDRVCIIVGRTRMTLQLGAETRTVESRYTHLFVLGEAGWQLVSAQGTPIIEHALPHRSP